MTAHKEYRLHLLGIMVYAGKEQGDPHYFHDMLEATGRMMHQYGCDVQPNRCKSPAALWLMMWAWDKLPGSVREAIRQHYMDVRREQTVIREDEEGESIEALSHHTPLTP